jgi:hypothetical protein
MRFFDLLLCAGLLLLAGFIMRLDVQDARSLNKLSTFTSNAREAPAPLRTLAGFDREGKATDQFPGGAKRVAIFVLHGPTFQADAALWNQARLLYPSLEFAGVCDDAECVRQAEAARGTLNFTAITMGDYYAMRWLLRSGSRGKFVVLNRENSATREIGSPKSSAELIGLKSALLEGQ